jgi:hypothetical protein
LVVDVRGKADAMGKPVDLEFTRNEKSISKNSLTLKKSKDGGKDFPGAAQIVLPVPEGVQSYAIVCDGVSELAMMFRLSKKAVKTNPAAAEVAVGAAPTAGGSTNADGGASDGATAEAAGDGGSPASGDPTQAYPGLFTHIGL